MDIFHLVYCRKSIKNFPFKAFISSIFFMCWTLIYFSFHFLFLLFLHTYPPLRTLHFVHFENQEKDKYISKGRQGKIMIEQDQNLYLPSPKFALYWSCKLLTSVLNWIDYSSFVVARFSIYYINEAIINRHCTTTQLSSKVAISCITYGIDLYFKLNSNNFISFFEYFLIDW